MPFQRSASPAVPVLLVAVVAAVAATGAAAAAEPDLGSDDHKTFYAMGLLMSQQLVGYDITEAELKVLAAGLTDGVLGRDNKVALEDYGPRIQGMLKPRAEAAIAREKTAGQAFVAKAAAETGAVVTDTGVVYVERSAGSGAAPGPDATVKLHYHGTLRDGSVFDSSRDGDPAEFVLNRVIPCFGAGIQKMKVGGKGRLVCPADQAYGDRGAPPKIRPGAALAFDIELLEIVEPGTPGTSDE